MTKQSGLGDNFYVDGLNISGDTQSISKLGGGPAVLEFTGIDKSAFERKGGLRDGGMDFVTYFNPGPLAFASPLVDTGSHALLRQMPLTDRIVTFFHMQSTDAASLVAKQGTYDGTRAADGALTIAVSAMANGFGLEWGDQLTPGPLTQSGAGNGTPLDSGAATTNFGAQAYLQVFNFVGTSAVVKIQSSSDNAVGDPYADVAGLTFSTVTAAPVAERIQTGRTAAIERWLRVATTGTFSALTFAVMVVRNVTAVDF